MFSPGQQLALSCRRGAVLEACQVRRVAPSLAGATQLRLHPPGPEAIAQCRYWPGLRDDFRLRPSDRGEQKPGQGYGRPRLRQLSTLRDGSIGRVLHGQARGGCGCRAGEGGLLSQLWLRGSEAAATAALLRAKRDAARKRMQELLRDVAPDGRLAAQLLGIKRRKASFVWNLAEHEIASTG